VQAAKRSFLPFEEAREIVRKVGLKSQKQWREWCRDAPRPADIPYNPDQTYKDKGWVSWRDWLGYGEGEPKSNEFLPFEEAREIVRAVGLMGREQWREWSRDCRPADIPSNPNITYADEGWVSYPDWLGYGVGRAARAYTPKSFLPFEEAREIVRKLGLVTKEEWPEWCRDAPRPANIPYNPDQTYKDKGWVSWRDWLGYGEGEPKSNEFLPFEEAREIVRAVGLMGWEQWREWSRDCRPADIPSRPDTTYADEGWVSMADWLRPSVPVRSSRTMDRLGHKN
jgi:hypothetical protein